MVEGTPIDVFDSIRTGMFDNRAQYFRDMSLPFYGYNRPGANVSEGIRDWFWWQSMQGGVQGVYDCIKVFSETDLTEDLKRMDVPTLIIHGDDDQIVPIGAAALKSAKIAPQATLKIYPGGPHGLPMIHQDQINADLLAFVTSERLQEQLV